MTEFTDSPDEQLRSYFTHAAKRLAYRYQMGLTHEDWDQMNAMILKGSGPAVMRVSHWRGDSRAVYCLSWRGRVLHLVFDASAGAVVTFLFPQNNITQAYKAKYGRKPFDGIPDPKPDATGMLPLETTAWRTKPKPLSGIPDGVRDPSDGSVSGSDRDSEPARTPMPPPETETLALDDDPLSPWPGEGIKGRDDIDVSKGMFYNPNDSKTQEVTAMEGSAAVPATAGSMFKKAEKRQGVLRVAFTGPSGSGKTYSALMLASGIGKKIAVIDTENHSASDYAGQFGFDTVSIEKPYEVGKFIRAFEAAVAAGYDVVIMDSISHAWVGEGGLLSMKETLDARGGNAFTNWAPVTKLHEQFKSMILQSPVHLIATMRSKQDYVVEQDGKGKSVPKKVGLAPIQREGMEYEFTLVFDLAMNHTAAVSKDRTGLFDSQIPFMVTKVTGEELVMWRMQGGEMTAPSLVPDAAPAASESDTLTPVPDNQMTPVPETPRAPVANGATKAASQESISKLYTACKAKGKTMSEEMRKRNFTGTVTEEKIQLILASL